MESVQSWHSFDVVEGIKDSKRSWVYEGINKGQICVTSDDRYCNE